jgi:hypothetical protein
MHRNHHRTLSRALALPNINAMELAETLPQTPTYPGTKQCLASKLAFNAIGNL